MQPPVPAERTVEDAAVDLILSVDALRRYRAQADLVAADLEARWAANGAKRKQAVATP
jgi:hypothetical protein